MIRAVDLHDQPRLETGEIGDEGANRHLAPELSTVETLGAKLAPDQSFDGRLFSPLRLGGGPLPAAHLETNHLFPFRPSSDLAPLTRPTSPASREVKRRRPNLGRESLLRRTPLA